MVFLIGKHPFSKVSPQLHPASHSLILVRSDAPNAGTQSPRTRVSLFTVGFAFGIRCVWAHFHLDPSFRFNARFPSSQTSNFLTLVHLNCAIVTVRLHVHAALVTQLRWLESSSSSHRQRSCKLWRCTGTPRKHARKCHRSSTAELLLQSILSLLPPTRSRWSIVRQSADLAHRSRTLQSRSTDTRKRPISSPAA